MIEEFLAQTAKNRDVDIDPGSIQILETKTRHIGRDAYEVKYRILVQEKEQQETGPEPERRIFRKIAMEESDPLYIDDITMSDTEFMDIITGKTGMKRTQVYKRMPYAAAMRKFLESQYTG